MWKNLDIQLAGDQIRDSQRDAARTSERILVNACLFLKEETLAFHPISRSPGKVRACARNRPAN